jgi:hypothetical protein
MLIRNLRGLDFGFDGLPPTARAVFKTDMGHPHSTPSTRRRLDYIAANSITPSRGAAD